MDLGEVIFMVADTWRRKKIKESGRSEIMFDTSLFDHQNMETAFEPEKRTQGPKWEYVTYADRSRGWLHSNNTVATWRCRITTDAGLNWRETEISIPYWLYEWLLSGKSTFISVNKITES